MVVGDVGDGAPVTILSGFRGVAQGGIEVEGGFQIFLCHDQVEFELLDRLLLRESVREAFAGELIRSGEGRHVTLEIVEAHRAGAGVKFGKVNDVQQGIFAIGDVLLGDDEGAAGVGYADFGGEDIEVGHHAGGPTRGVFIEEVLVALEGELTDADGFARGDEVVIGGFSRRDHGKNAARVAEQGDVDPELAAAGS